MEKDYKNLCIDELEVFSDKILTILDLKSNEISSTHEIIEREQEIEYCPYCGSKHIVKNGHTSSKAQKYLCKDCRKSVSATTNKIIAYSKKPYRVWKDFIECEINLMPLRKTAQKIGISLPTAFYWRHKVHESIKYIVNQTKLSGKIQIDATYLRTNFKGTKKCNMVRKSKKRGSSDRKRGLSNDKLCIMTAVDENDNMFFQLTGVGRENIQKYRHVYHFIENPSLIVSDQAWGYTTMAKELDCELDQIGMNCHKTLKGNGLSELNQLHSEFKIYISRFKGVSLNHLQGYMDFFVFLKTLNYKFDYHEGIQKLYIDSICSNTKLLNSEICNMNIHEILLNAELYLSSLNCSKT